MQSRLARVLAVAAVALLAGCGTGGAPMATPTPSESSGRPPFQTVSPQPSASPSASAEASVPPKRWAAILDDLATRGAPTDAVELVSARSVTWNDGSLGCPKPGQMYTQALVNGLHVIVSVAGNQYDYRFGNSDKPKLCER